MMKSIKKIIFLLSVLAVMAFGVTGTAFAETYTYDKVGRLTRVIFGDGSSMAYAYDNNGNILSKTLLKARPIASEKGPKRVRSCNATFGRLWLSDIPPIMNRIPRSYSPLFARFNDLSTISAKGKGECVIAIPDPMQMNFIQFFDWSHC